MLRTVNGKKLYIAKVSDANLAVAAGVADRVEKIVLDAEYARTLASVGGAGALLVHRSIQELVRRALKDTFPQQSHPSLSETMPYE